MLLQQVEKFLSKFEKYFFKYKDGFYHLPYVADSPQNIIASLGSMPFVQHNKQEQVINSNNPFCTVKMHYHQLEPEFWVMYAETEYKKNVRYNLVRDKKNQSNYYFVSLNFNESKLTYPKQIVNENITMSNLCWTFFKPNENIFNLNFKDVKSKYITIYFSEKWLITNLVNSALYEGSDLQKFINSNNTHIVLPDTTNEQLKEFEIFNAAFNTPKIDVLSLKHNSLNLIFNFLKLPITNNEAQSNLKIDDKERTIVHTIEHELLLNLHRKFPGITELAQKHSISESKLKTDFKLLFAKPIYQYYQEKQMILAKQMVLEKKHLIKEIATMFGYENVSKFSQTFKKHHTVSPSDL